MTTEISSNISNIIDISSSIKNGYTPSVSGWVSVQTGQNGVTHTLSINNVQVASAYQYSGDSHGSESKQLMAIVGAGQTVKSSEYSLTKALFIPFGV